MIQSSDSLHPKDTFERNKITVKSLQEHPVVLVTDDRSTLVEADHPPDEGTSEFSWAPRVAHQKLEQAFFVAAERSDWTTWPEESNATTISIPRSPHNDSP